MFTKISKHSDLMGRMAERAGVDIGAEVLDGSFEASKYRAAVIRCTHCTSVDECETMLAQGDHEGVPEFCLNKQVIRQLADD